MTLPARRRRPIRSDRVNQDMPAARVVAKFDGLSRFCVLTGFKTSTVWGWLIKGFIPGERQAYILDRAAFYDIPLDAAEFVHQPQGLVP